MGRRSAAIKCDVTDRDQVQETVARVVEEFGSVDILINNAGTLDHVGQFHDQNPDLWERDLRVNLTGGFNCAQAVWPHMKERNVGPDRQHGLGRGHARRLRPGELLDDQGRDPRPDADAGDGGRPARDHVQRDRAGHHRHRGVPLREPGDERADRQSDGLQAARASPRTSRTRSASSAPTSPRTSPASQLNVSGGVELFVF